MFTRVALFRMAWIVGVARSGSRLGLGDVVVAGAIVRFAVPATFTYALNAHIVSVIVMLAGVFGCGVPLPGNGMVARRAASVMFVEAVTGSPRCGKAGTGRRTPLPLTVRDRSW